MIYMFIASLSACSIMAPSIKTRSVSIDVSPKANDDTPIAIDFLAVNDPALLQILLTMKSVQWFAQREQFQRDYPQALTVWSHELVPGQHVSFERVPLKGTKALALIVFANYHDVGSHRLRLDNTANVAIHLDSKDLRLVTPQ